MPKSKKSKEAITNQRIAAAFESAAQAVVPEFLQLCEEMGEEPVVERDAVCDYLYQYDAEVAKYLTSLGYDAYSARCDEAGVPKEWA